jgi:hypothetical protein
MAVERLPHMRPFYASFESERNIEERVKEGAVPTWVLYRHIACG